MFYREIRPSALLRPWVDRYWILRGESATPQPDLILPDGSVEWVFHLAEAFDECDGAMTPRRQAQAIVVGQVRRPTIVIPSCVFHVIGVRFRPGVAGAFLPVAMSELLDSIVDVRAMHDSALHELSQRLLDDPDDEARVARIETFLAGRASTVHVGEVDRWVAAMFAGGIVDPRVIARREGLSVRTVQRRFVERTGMAARELARLARFVRAVRILRSGGRSADAAIDCGYYDQPHMARDFREFASTTPAVVAAVRSPVADVFVDGGNFAAAGR